MFQLGGGVCKNLANLLCAWRSNFQSRFLTKANGIHTLQMGLVSIPFFSHWHHGPMGPQSHTPSTPRLALADFGAVPKGRERTDLSDKVAQFGPFMWVFILVKLGGL